MATKQDNRRGLESGNATAEENRRAPSGAHKSPILIDEAGIAELIWFFRLLRKWKQEARYHEKM
jgi:hypothetical protein